MVYVAALELETWSMEVEDGVEVDSVDFVGVVDAVAIVAESVPEIAVLDGIVN